MRTLGERVRKARLEAGLSQAQLGTPHFTRAYVSAIELGKVRPAVKSLDFMAARLGKPASYFLEDEASEERRRGREVAINEVAALLGRATAAQALDLVAGLLEGATSPLEMARLHLYSATALNFLDRGADALRDLTVAERLTRQLHNERLERAVRYQTAISLRLTGEHARSKALLEDLLQSLESSPIRDELMRVKLLKDLGAVAYDMGDIEAASGYYNSALELSKDVGDVAGLISIYHGLALAHRARGDLDAASGYLQRALGATEVANDLAYSATLHNALAVIAAERGHVQAAYDHVDRAIELARVNGPAAYMPHFLNTKAECAVRVHDWDKAATFAREAMDAAAGVSNQRAAAAAHVVLAEVAEHARNHGEGVSHLREAVAIYETLSARSELGDVYMRLSKLALSAGDQDEAREYATKAYEVMKSPSGLVGRTS